jgi:hypothetical protein
MFIHETNVKFLGNCQAYIPIVELLKFNFFLLKMLQNDAQNKHVL